MESYKVLIAPIFRETWFLCMNGVTKIKHDVNVHQKRENGKDKHNALDANVFELIPASPTHTFFFLCFLYFLYDGLLI